MAGASFELDLSALEKVVDRLSKRMRDQQALAESIGATLVSSTLDRFRQGEDPKGKAWLVSQRAERKGGKTLVYTGALQNSIVYEASPSVIAVGTVGSSKIYARIHQEGGKAGRGRKVTIPKRSFLGISKEDLKEIRALMREHLRGK